MAMVPGQGNVIVSAADYNGYLQGIKQRNKVEDSRDGMNLNLKKQESTLAADSNTDTQRLEQIERNAKDPLK